MEHLNKLLSRFVLMKLHMEGPTSALPVYCTRRRTYMYQEINWL